MSTATLRKAALLIVAVAVFGSSAFAREERHEHKRDGRERHERMERREHRERFERARVEERRRQHERWERRREEERRRHERERWAAEHRRGEHHPDGWDRGKKNGWHGNDVPPGQAKKYDRNPQFHGTDHVRSDHDRDWSHKSEVRTTSTGSNRDQKSRPFRAMLGHKQ